MELVFIFLSPIIISIAVGLYNLIGRAIDNKKRKKLKSHISNFIKFCNSGHWDKYEEGADNIVYRRIVDDIQLRDIKDVTGINIELPDACHLYEYLFVTDSPTWETRKDFAVTHHGGLELHHNYSIEIDGLHQGFGNLFRKIASIARHDEFECWRYNNIINEDKNSAYFELVKNIYPKRKKDYEDFTRYLMTSKRNK